jgi:hypothetical protein
MIRYALILIAFITLSSPLFAQERQMRPFKEGEAVSIESDKAYILFRAVRPKGTASIEPVLLRVPDKEEVARYLEAKTAAFAKEKPKLIEKREALLAKKEKAESRGKTFKKEIPPEPSLANFVFDYEGIANVENVDDSKAFVKAKPESTYLVAVKPGDYIIYAASFGSGILKPFLHTCFSLGTVGFTVKPGEITDLGYWYGDGAKFKSDIPELAEETGFGPSSDTPFVLATGTVRPARADSSLPTALTNQPIVQGEYRAVGKFFNAACGGINRMPPVPGILAYQGGKVVDGKTGEIVADNYP